MIVLEKSAGPGDEVAAQERVAAQEALAKASTTLQPASML